MENEVDLLQVYYMVMRRKWIIVYSTLGALMLSMIYSFFIVQPVYEASVSIIIGKEEARLFWEDRYTNSDISLYVQVAKTYEEIAKSRTVLKRTRELLGDQGFDEIKEIKIVAKPNTQVLMISVSHRSPGGAAIWADALGEVFIQVAGEVLPAGQLSILDIAQQPKAPISPNRKVNIGIGGILGIMLGIGIALLFGYISPAIETEEDVKQYLDLPILGVVSE